MLCLKMRCEFARPNSEFFTCPMAMTVSAMSPCTTSRTSLPTCVDANRWCPPPGSPLGRIMQTRQVAHIADIKESRVTRKVER